MCHRAKFHKNRLNRGQDMVILYIFQDGGHQHLGFSKFQFFKGQNGQEGGTASQCQILSKSLQPWPKYRDFSILQDGGCRHLGFSKLKFLEGQIASLCQISSKSLELRPRYDFSIFQEGGRRHLGFSKFEIFNVRNGQEGRTASSCQISPKSFKPRLKYASLNIMLVWFENAYLRPHLQFFGHISLVLPPKRTILEL